MAWTLDSVFPAGTQLNLDLCFLPQALAPTHVISCLDDDEKLKLNQIAGNAYLNMCVFIELFIISRSCTQIQSRVLGDPVELHALMRLAEEELRHQKLFGRFMRAFERSLGHECGVLVEPSAVANEVMRHSALATFTTWSVSRTSLASIPVLQAC